MRLSSASLTRAHSVECRGIRSGEQPGLLWLRESDFRLRAMRRIFQCELDPHPGESPTGRNGAQLCHLSCPCVSPSDSIQSGSNVNGTDAPSTGRAMRRLAPRPAPATTPSTSHPFSHCRNRADSSRQRVLRRHVQQMLLRRRTPHEWSAVHLLDRVLTHSQA